MTNSPHMTGHSIGTEHSVLWSDPVANLPHSLNWMTDDLVSETVQIWSPVYGEPLTTQDAIELLQNVKRFAEVLMSEKTAWREK